MSRQTLRLPRSFGFVSVMLALAACTPEKPPVTPDGTKPTGSTSAVASTGPVAPSGPDPYVAAGPFAEEALPTVETAPLAAGALVLSPAPAGVGAAPAVCATFLKNTPPKEAPSCGDRASAIAALDRAIALMPTVSFDTPAAFQNAQRNRDDALAALESCAGLPSGMVRALRVELLPMECADVVAEPVLKAPPKDMRGDVHEALFGLALAARLGRAGGSVPAMTAPYTKDRVEKFINGPLGKWMKDVATGVQDISAAASKLHFYGGAIAATAAGIADLALVDIVRSAPIPDEYQKDEERKNVYYASLDERLEPRKTRGRDASLVGMKKFAEVGAINDSRVSRARFLLSKLYGGRRIDALDRLILPAIPVKSPATAEDRLARSLPTFYAGLLLDPKVATEPGVLAAFAHQGVPLEHRKALHGATLTDETAALAGFARLALGRTYWRSTDFEEAAKAASSVSAGARTGDTKLLAALAMGLRGGPKDAIEMMVKSPLGMNALGQRAALDALAAEKGPLSGAAAFDAAYLMEIAAPEKADGIFFKSLAKRYRAAAELLTDAKQKAEAEERAKAVDAISAQVP